MFLLAVISVLGVVVPYLGFVGVVPVWRGRGRMLGVVGILTGIAWLVLPSRPIAHGACPRIYSFDGASWKLDADLLASSLYAWAERREVARLERLRPSGGEYRLRLQNDRDEIDHVNGVSLTVVDHAADVEVLPTVRGEVVAVKGAQPAIGGSEFARPPGKSALLLIRGRASEFAEEALFRYLVRFGQGIGPLMDHAMLKAGCVCAEEVLDEELQRLGLPLEIFVGERRYQVNPIGPALTRSFVVPIELPPGERVSIRLQSTPRFWEIEEVRLAPVSDGALKLQVKEDARKLTLHKGEAVDLHFAVPPPSGAARTVLVAVRGWYQVPVGGQPMLNLVAVAAHRLGVISLPDFAAGLR